MADVAEILSRHRLCEEKICGRSGIPCALQQKTVILFYCLTVTALAVNDKQLKLDDIEKDTLVNERKVNQDTQVPTKYVSSTSASSSSLPQKFVSPSQLQYGFKPMKSTQKYVQQQQQQQLQQHQPQEQQYQQQLQQYQIPQQLQYIYPQYPSQFSYTQFPQYQYQQYENLPYVVDNQLVQNTRTDQQQYFGQQYVYVQPVSAPSNNIQMVVDPKGNIKYYMYVPTQYFSEVKNGDGSVRNIQVQTTPPSAHNVGPQIFTREPDYRHLANTESQFITQPQLPPQPVTPQVQYVQPTQESFANIQLSQPTQESLVRNQYLQPPQESFGNSQYTLTTQESFAKNSLIQPTQEPVTKNQLVQTVQTIQEPPANNQFIQPTQETLIKNQFVQKVGPQSLLDSYVPSLLQLQYFKQQQESQANAIKDTPKTVVPRTTLTKHTLRIPNASVETTYSFPLPSPYRTQTFRN